eukprot:5059768-Prymnesium_polylepis.2
MAEGSREPVLHRQWTSRGTRGMDTRRPGFQATCPQQAERCTRPSRWSCKHPTTAIVHLCTSLHSPLCSRRGTLQEMRERQRCSRGAV